MKCIFIILLMHDCSATKLSLRIHGGIDANPEDYPYVVRLEKQISYNLNNNTVIARHKHVCTSSALTAVWLISAAHCIYNAKRQIILTMPRYTVIKMVIRYGHVENSPWEKNTFSDVLNMIMHPLYRKKKIGQSLKNSRNDIGLLRTAPMNIRYYMKISAVDYQTMYGHEAIIGGFGIMTQIDTKGNIEMNSTLYLMKPLQLLEVLISKCRPQSKLVPGLCLASKCSGMSNACPGDSGGPVIHPSGLIGVIALGKSKCRGKLRRIKTAATITPVSPYIEWINNYVNT